MMQSNRRNFFKTTTAVTSGLALSSSALAQGAGSEENGDEKKLRVAAIGVGGSKGRYNRGGAIARQAAKYGKMVAVCDVVDLHCEEFNNSFQGQLETFTDYRVMLDEVKPDVVTIGTPDHWHVPMAIAALEAGAHVYCEKPLTLTIDEGKQIREAVERTGKVFQVGTQQRSSISKFLTAIAIVRSGRLGDNVNAYLAIGGTPVGGPFETTDVPEGIDWDLWLGPAPKADYSDERRRMFRWYFDYSGGKMTDWGAHHIDIAQWAIAPGEDGPVKVSGTGKFTDLVPENFNWKAYLDGDASLPNGFHTATQFDIKLTFANGRFMNVTNHYKREEGKIGFGNGILFEGEKGRIFVNRGKIQGKLIDTMTDDDRAELDEIIGKLANGKKPGDHMWNFFDCIFNGGKPISDVWSHHRTMTSCHLCNINLMLGRDLKWDPKAEHFIDDEDANALMTRKSREIAMAVS